MIPGSDTYNLVSSLAMIFVVWCGYSSIKVCLQLRSEYYALIALIGWLYPLGKALQIWLVGPDFVRWYLADVGFVSFAGALVASGLTHWNKKSYLYNQRKGFVIATAAAFLFELLQLSPLAKRKEEGSVVMTGAGDWVDLNIFPIMFAINCWLLALTVRQLNRRHVLENPK